MFYIYADNQLIYKPLDEYLTLFSPRLTLEIGKAGSLEFSIPPTNTFYNRLSQLTTEITLELDNEELFHGRVLSNTRGFSNIRQIYCEGDLSYLVDSVQKGVKYNGTTHALFRKIIENHNSRVGANKRFTVGEITIEDRDIILVGNSESENVNTGEIDYEQIAIDSIVDNWNNSFDYIQNCLIAYCGGYLRTRRVNGVTYIDLMDSYTGTSSQEIELGQNLLDFTEEISADSLYTVLIPLGNDNLTIASVNNGSDELVDENAVAQYGRIVRTHVFRNVTSAQTLLENAQRYLSYTVNVPRTISVKAVDLHLINPSIKMIHLGDRVRLNSNAHDIDDFLTCTKVEYDLEHPENNNYIFGNPRQSLTQRYREDRRVSNDTYGNSGGGIGGGDVSISSPDSTSLMASSSPAGGATSAGTVAAKAAEATAKEQKKERKKALDDFYKEWINVDPDNPDGHIDLGALYEYYVNGKKVLEQQCGIDLDATTGNIDIRSFKAQYDTKGNEIDHQIADIKTIQDEHGVSIQSTTEKVTQLDDREVAHYTAINQRSDDLSSSIDLVARNVTTIDGRERENNAAMQIFVNDLQSRITQTTDYVAELDDREVRNYTSITQKTDANSSSIRSLANTVTENDRTYQNNFTQITQSTTSNSSKISLIAGEVTKNKQDIDSNSQSIARIDLIVQGHTSTISLKADKTEVTGVLTAAQAEINKLTTGQTTASALRANDIKAGSISIWSEGGNGTVTTMAHAHTIAAREDANGQVTISMGMATTTYPQTASFNIANTKFYKDGVAAVTIKSSSLKSSVYESANKRYNVKVQATLANESTKELGPFYVNASDAWTAGETSGKNSITISSVGFNKAASSDPGWTFSGNTYTVKLKATASNGKTGTGTVTIDASSQINSATNAVTVKSIARTSGVSETYETANKRYKVPVTATASNGKTKSDFVYVSATSAFDAGKAAGLSEGKATAINVTLSREKNDEYKSTTHNTWVYAQAVASNGTASKTAKTTFAVDGTSAYNDGVASGKATAINVTLSRDKNDEYKSGTHNTWVYAKAVASNGTASKTATATFAVDGSTAYSDGYSAGQSAGSSGVYVSGIVKNSESYVARTKSVTVSVTATASNGATKSTDLSVSAGTAYWAGYDVGYDAGQRAASSSSSGSSGSSGGSQGGVSFSGGPLDGQSGSDSGSTGSGTGSGYGSSGTGSQGSSGSGVYVMSINAVGSPANGYGGSKTLTVHYKLSNGREGNWGVSFIP